MALVVRDLVHGASFDVEAVEALLEAHGRAPEAVMAVTTKFR